MDLREANIKYFGDESKDLITKQLICQAGEALDNSTSLSVLRMSP